MIDVVVMAARIESVALLDFIGISIYIFILGKIEPTSVDGLSRQSSILYITFGEFEVIAKRLKGEILDGVVMPKNEEEIRRIIFRP